LHRFYLNGKDAFRLVLAISPSAALKRSASTGSGSDTSSLGSVTSEDTVDDDDGEEDDWEDVSKLVRLRRKVATLRAAKFTRVWEVDNEDVSSR